MRLQMLYPLALLIFMLGTLAFLVRATLRTAGARSTTACTATTQQMIHRAARLLFTVLRKLALLEVTTSGFPAQRISPPPCVVVANHPSMLDALLLVSLLPNAVCIMKPSLLRIPGLSGLARRAGYIPHGAAPALLERAEAALAAGSSIIIFPEGTRSKPGSLGTFQRGAVRIALQAGVPIEAIALEMSPVVLGRARPWWRAPSTVVRYHATRLTPPAISAHPPLNTPDDPKNLEQLRAPCIQYTKELEELFRFSLYSGAALRNENRERRGETA
jgi:1-acyl-sn-glycerol-3-phosphate acyltransferase